MSSEAGALLGHLQNIARPALQVRQNQAEPTHHYVPQNASYIEDFTRGLLGVHLTLDLLLSRILWSILGLVCVIVMGTRWIQMGHHYLRLAASSEASLLNQRYWSAEPSTWWAWLKKHVLYAPLFGKRHNREFTISRVVNVGVIPSRLHTALITAYVLMQIAYCCILSYSANDKAALIAELRGRSGSLALLNMIPLFIFASRNNPLISVLQVSFDTFNLYHRWLGRITAAEAIVHTCAWATNAVAAEGWSHMFWNAFHVQFFLMGTIGVLGMTVLVLHSPSPIRHAFYETFLSVHQLVALVIVVVVGMHLKIDSLPQCSFFWFIPAYWAGEKIVRLARVCYMNYAWRHGFTKCTIEALPQEACRVTFSLPKTVEVSAGSHVYAYFPRFSLWMSHPFSVAWAHNDLDSFEQASIVAKEYSDQALAENPLPRSLTVKANQRLGEHGRRRLEERLGPGSLASTSTWLVKPSKEDREHTRVSLVIAARTGLTRQLYERALQHDGKLHCWGGIEGPYNSHPSSFNSYGTVVLFSGGAGITHHLLHVRNLLYQINSGVAATRKIQLIWSVRNIECFSWVTSFMNEVLAIPHRKRYLSCKLYVSRPDERGELQNLSSAVEMLAGRCKPHTILNDIMGRHYEGQGTGAVVVSVCGPGAFADDVRKEVRDRIGQGVLIDFVEEAFSW